MERRVIISEVRVSVISQKHVLLFFHVIFPGRVRPFGEAHEGTKEEPMRAEGPTSRKNHEARGQDLLLLTRTVLQKQQQLQQRKKAVVTCNSLGQSLGGGDHVGGSCWLKES